MLAVDTNVIVRYLVGDHPVQSKKARDLLDSEDVFVSKTVLLETEWVLRKTFGFSRAEIVPRLRSFAGLPTVTMEDDDQVALALDWTEAGMDLADALHLAGAGGCDAFVSFDARLVRAANKITSAIARAP